jgi:hypothetical protein
MIVAGLSCTPTPAPLDLTSQDPSQDQRKIASFHSREALLFQLKAEELSQQAAAYERLFGPESEWVVGARLLVEFYRDAAKEQEYLASWHLGIADNGHVRSLRSISP